MVDGAPRRTGVALLLLCLAQFLVVLDTTIVNVALPRIGADLGFASEVGLQYVLSLYAVTFGGMLLVAGRAADLLGRRRMLMSGLLVFTAASLACGLAPSASVLLLARTVQGVGSALTSAAALALLTQLFAEGPARNRALGAWGAVGGAAGACGLILGGTLTDTLGWPSVFLINIPLGLGAACVAPRLLPGSAARQTRGLLDLPGAVTVSGGLGLLILGLSQDGHPAVTVGVLVAAGVLLAAFVLIERRVDRPLVAPGLFTIPGVATANVAMLTLTMIVASGLFFTTLYTQQVLQLSPLQTGLAFLPNSALVISGSAMATRLARRWRPGVLLTIGFGLLIAANLLLSGISAHGSYVADVLPGFALTGLGQGIAFVAVTIAATRNVPETDHGLASGMINSAQQVGFAVGLAVVIAAASALTGPAAPPVAEYVTGYRLDAVLATIGLLLALALARAHQTTRRHHRVTTT